MRVFSDKGIVKYYNDGTISLKINQEIVNYYRSLIPKYIWVQPLKYPAHITIVRGVVESPNFLLWGLDKGSAYNYTYSSQITIKDKYAFLDCYSQEIGLLRESLGLSEFRNGFDSYHITIARIIK